MADIIKIATRKSPLALWQANYVAARLKANDPALIVRLVTIVTKGDKILDAPLAKIGGKGLFVKELEQALIKGDADIAVHSMKDVPMVFPPGLVLNTICAREQPYDAFVSNKYKALKELPLNAVVGTSSLRRKSQLLSLRSDLKIKDLRGNVGTRLKKLDQDQYDAIILAEAGLLRLGLKNRIRETIATDLILPAVGQGAVGIECREDDKSTMSKLVSLHCTDTASRVGAERAMNRRLNGGCQVPIAGYAIIKHDKIVLKGLVASEDGRSVVYKESVGEKKDFNKIGLAVAEKLLAAGAEDILKEMYLETRAENEVVGD